MLEAPPPVRRCAAEIARFPAGQLTTRTFGVEESWALASATISRLLRPVVGSTEAGNFLLELRASRRPALGDFDAWIPSTLSAFRANRTTSAALRAAWPSGVMPATATTRAVMERTRGRRRFMQELLSLAHVSEQPREATGRTGRYGGARCPTDATWQPTSRGSRSSPI